MRDEDKTKEQLIYELMELRRRNAELAELGAQWTKAREKLRESEEKFRNLAQQSPNMIFINKRGRVVYANEKCQEVMGYRREEFYSPDFDFLILIAPEYRDTIFAAFNSHMRGEELSPLEYALLTKKSERIDAILATKLIRYEGETAILGIVTDITERKKAEQALCESEERFQQIAENAQAWTWEVDASGLYTYVGSVVEKMLGYRPEEIVGKKHFYDLLHPDDREQLRNDAFKAFAQKLPFREFINRNIRKDGETVWLSTSGIPVIDEEGNLLGYRGADTDITERKQAEEKLRSSEERYRLLAEKSPLGLSIIGRDGSYKYINDQFKRMFGYALDDIPTGREWFRKAYPDEEYRKKVISTWLSDLESAESSEPRPRIYSVTCKNGEVKEVLFRPVTTETGDEFVLYEDITERVRTDKQLKASLREKEVMLREIHHRVKNNLQVISSLLNMSCMQTQNQEAIALLADAQTRVLAMALIHSQLYQTERFDRMDMGILVRSLFAHLANVYATRSRFVTPVILEGTGVFLPITQAIPCSLVLNEVISNIFKHAFKEGQRGTVEISVQNPTNSRIHIRIKDDGVGIPEDIDIHETYSIGLSLIRTLVQDQLEGTLQINRNNGTEFIMEFPKT